MIISSPCFFSAWLIFSIWSSTVMRRASRRIPTRQLSEKGRWEATQVAKRMAVAKIKVRLIIHSGKLRAKQTAEIMANHLKPEGGISEMQGLSPNDSPIMANEFIKSAGKSGDLPIMIVGHLPGLDKLSSLLITGKEDSGVISFRMAAAVCLENDPKWKVAWILPPELV